MAEVCESLPANAIVTLDTGAMCLQAADRMRFGMSLRLLTLLDFGYAAALGAKALAPERPAVSIMGDRRFGMTIIEMKTAVQHDLPVVAVVLDNGAWGAEKAYQRDFFGARYLGVNLHNPDYAAFAKQIGAVGHRSLVPEEVSPAMEDTLACGKPAVIQITVDPDAMFSLRKDLFKPGDNRRA